MDNGPGRASSDVALHALAACLVLLFAALVYRQGATLDPTARDQAADMNAALRIREGGPLSDGSRSPLFPALLAPFASRSESFFVDARLVSVVLPALAALVLYAASARVFGAWIALLGMIGFLFELRFQARRICPEPLVALLIVGATLFFAEGEERGRRRVLALGAGLLLGMAWMAKGTALLSLAAFVAVALALLRRPRLGGALLLLAGFLAGGAPLLLFNGAHFGSPFFNASSTHVMWEDAWDQDLDRTSTATAKGYLETHRPAEILRRLFHGLFHQKAVEWIYAYLLLLLLAWRARRRKAADHGPGGGARRTWHGTVLFSCLLWLPPIAWYEPIVASRRFLFPILAPLVPAGIDLLARLLPERSLLALEVAGGICRRAAPWLAGAAALGALALVVLHGNPYRERHFDGNTLALVRHLHAPRYRNARILAEPSRTVPVEWLLPGGTGMAAIPYAVPDSDAQEWIRTHADFLLLNRGLLALRPAPFRAYATWDDATGLAERDLPPWLEADYRDPGKPCRYLLLRVVPTGGG